MKKHESKKHTFSACFISCLLAFFILDGCGGSSTTKVAFMQPSLEGLWKMVSFGYQPNGSFSSSGFMAMDASGNLTGGEINNFGVDIERFTSGTITVTKKGYVTGIINTFLPDSCTTEKYQLLAGQMALQKDMIVYIGKFPVANRGIGILVKQNNNFSVSDLEGTWVFPLEGIFSVSVNSSGAITHCTFLPVEEDAKGCKGNFSITPQGDVSGILETIDGKTFKINFNGQMNSNKDGMILAGGISTRFEGMAILAIKKDGVFSLEDRKGSWKIFIVAYKDVLHGTININSSGVVTGGDWTTLRAGSGTFEGGTLSLTNQGDVTGFINTSTGDTYIIIGGQMVSTKDLIEFLSKDEAGRYGVAILIKTP